MGFFRMISLGFFRMISGKFLRMKYLNRTINLFVLETSVMARPQLGKNKTGD
jgi:hypothetical protein